MGEVIKNGSQTKYYKILNGGIVRDAFEGDAGAIKVNVKNPKTGIEKEKWVIPIFAIEGVIDSLKIIEQDMDGVKFKKVILKIKDGNELLQIETKFKTEHGISLINRLAKFVKLDLKKTPIVIGSYKIKDKDSQRFNQGFYIHYGDEKISNYYTKDNMPVDTKWVEKTVNGETVWDKTNYLRFFLAEAESVITPYFENLKKQDTPEIVEESKEVDYEEVF
jgi:hypothetical protein